MHSEIEQVLKQLIVMIQMWIDFISSSSRSAVVIAEAIEVDNKPFKFILPFEVSVTCACINKTSLRTLFIIHVKFFSCKKFLWVSLPMKIFNNEIFPDYGIHTLIQPVSILFNL